MSHRLKILKSKLFYSQFYRHIRCSFKNSMHSSSRDWLSSFIYNSFCYYK